MKMIISSLCMFLLFVICGCGREARTIETRMYEWHRGVIQCDKCRYEERITRLYDLDGVGCYGVTRMSSDRKMNDIWEVTLVSKCPKHGEFECVVECSYRDKKTRFVRYVK